MAEQFDFAQALKYMCDGIPVTRPKFNGFRLAIKGDAIYTYLGLDVDELIVLSVESILANDWMVPTDD